MHGVHSIVTQRLRIIRFVSVYCELSRAWVEAVQPRLSAEPQKSFLILGDFLVLDRVLIFLGRVHNETSRGRIETSYTAIHGGPQISRVIMNQLHDRAGKMRRQPAGIRT